MHIDFSQTNDSVFETDVCVIGAGAAGFSCALSLLNSGLRVLVLEGGLNTFDQRAADLHRGQVINHPHEGIETARERIVGGTTTTWGGQACPFMAEDFEKRTHIKHSGWCLSLEDLEPYYRKAETILGTDSAVSFDYRPWKDWGIEEPGFSPSTLDLFVTKWCKIPNFAVQHGSKIEKSDNVTLLRNANVVEILPSESLNKVEALRIRSLDGKDGLVKARYIIAAGGALETVRLFLCSTRFGDRGLGNGYGFVGRYFQDHVGAIVGQILPESRKWLHEVFDPFYKRGFKYFPRIRLCPAFAAKSEILHASAQIVFSEETDAALGAAKQILSNLRKKQTPELKIWKSFASPPEIWEIVKAALRWKIKKRGSSSPSAPIWLEIHSEQEPVWESNVELSDSLDALGMRRIRLNWTISDLTVSTFRDMAILVREEFDRVGMGKVILEPWVKGLTDNPFRWFYDTYHQAGGLRMANSKAEGVVDSSCRVFGVENLYVASSAVFPTSSFSNPTMTTIALAIRISEIVEQRLKNIKK